MVVSFLQRHSKGRKLNKRQGVSMYNVKVKDYGNGQVQTRIYSHPVYTGQKSKPEPQEMMETPFEPGVKVPVVLEFEDAEKQHERSVSVSLKRAKQKIYDLSRANEWEYFVTLTFDPNKVHRYDYTDCVKKLSKWLNHMRPLCGPDFKYLVVPELHKDGAYHFHGLFAGCDGIEIVDSGHVTRSGDTIYNFGKYKLGWSTATKVTINEAVIKYITKYCTKELVENTKNKRRYWASRNLDVPKETTIMMDYQDTVLLHEELVSDDIQHFKTTNYWIGPARRAVSYYEHLEGDTE